jgi:hypothetical protein
MNLCGECGIESRIVRGNKVEFVNEVKPLLEERNHFDMNKECRKSKRQEDGGKQRVKESKMGKETECEY